MSRRSGALRPLAPSAGVAMLTCPAASREGWRSRSVYKLEQVDSRVRLFRKGMVCVDLGACPGGWSQYAAAKIGSAGRLLAVDLKPMDPVPGVDFIQGDFTDADVREQLISALDGERAGLVMSDMAPNITGYPAVDQPRAMRLAEEALEFPGQTLPGRRLRGVCRLRAKAIRERADHQAGGVEAGKPRNVFAGERTWDVVVSAVVPEPTGALVAVGSAAGGRCGAGRKHRRGWGLERLGKERDSVDRHRRGAGVGGA